MVQSIERGIEILRLLEAGPLGVTELANATALPKTTVHRLLKTFEGASIGLSSIGTRSISCLGAFCLWRSPSLRLWMCVLLRSHTWWLFAISCSSP